MRKQYLPLIVVLGLLCVFFAWVFGGSNVATVEAQSTTAKAEDPSLVDQKLAEAAFITSAIEYLDSGRPQDAAHLLRLRQGADILTINEMLSSASEQTRRTAAQLFSRIAKSRPTWRTDYHGDLPQADTNSAAKVESILIKYR